MTDSTKIIRIESVEPSANLNKLFSELKGSDFVPDTGRINSLISSGNLALYFVMQNGVPVGMASVVPCRTAASNKLWVEDVCVLSECRGKGYGRQLLSFLLKDAKSALGDGTFWLTSRPSRVSARALYKSLGFVEYETGVFYL